MNTKRCVGLAWGVWFAALVCCSTPAKAYSVRKSSRSIAALLVPLKIYTLPFTSYRRCNLRYGDIADRARKMLDVKYAVKARDFCRARRMSLQKLNVVLNSAYGTKKHAGVTRKCVVKAVVYAVCRRRILYVTSYKVGAFAQGRMSTAAPRPCSMGNRQNAMHIMATKRAKGAAARLCYSRKLPRVSQLKRTRTYPVRQTIARGRYMCTRSYLYSFTCTN